MVAIAVAAFVAIAFFKVPFPAIILAAALAGLVMSVAQRAPARNARKRRSPHPAREAWGAFFGSVAVWGAVWLVPVALLAALFGMHHVFTEVALFFSKVAVVTFGGAYAVLAYVAQQAVEVQHWLRPDEMLTGLGLAETTPGPLILVLVFVGFLAGFRGETGLDPLAAGLLGAADHALGDLRAVLPVHLRRRALRRAAPRQPLRRRRARRRDRGGGRRHRQPGLLVRPARALRGGRRRRFGPFAFAFRDSAASIRRAALIAIAAALRCSASRANSSCLLWRRARCARLAS